MDAARVATAANRFGLGAKPGDIASAPADARNSLMAQLRPAALASSDFDGLPGSVEYLRSEYQYRQARRQKKKSSDGTDEDVAQKPRRRRMLRMSQNEDAGVSSQGMRRTLRQQQLAEVTARYRHAAQTDTPFVERLVRFWSNHFAVSVDKGAARLYAAPMEREAIRPNVLGKFSDLLMAVETHPAMLRYLDNNASVGDDSMVAQRFVRRDKGKKLGLNENLAREILELHTLGADSGYTQTDVTEFARAITGWGTPRPVELQRDSSTSAFAFHAAAHEPGTRNVLGKRYAEDGMAQGRAILSDLSRSPATAKHLSTKLARHFVSDAPPPALVERMARAYLAHDGDLSALYREMIESPEAWSAGARKLKTPDDFVVSAMRAGGMDLAAQPQALLQLLERLGQPVFTPRSPAGFPDTAADWGGADALWKRVQAAGALADRVPPERGTPLSLARASLGDAAVSGDFAKALQRAGSPKDGFALLFASPAFQWRT